MVTKEKSDLKAENLKIETDQKVAREDLKGRQEEHKEMRFLIRQMSDQAKNSEASKEKIFNHYSQQIVSMKLVIEQLSSEYSTMGQKLQT
jgi:hypothetical protein